MANRPAPNRPSSQRQKHHEIMTASRKVYDAEERGLKLNQLQS
jgi:hypothetical protein